MRDNSGKVLVTGASGFVGTSLILEATARGYQVRCALRHAVDRETSVAVGDIGPSTDWSQALQGVDAIVHLAGRAHVMTEHGRDALQEFRRVNVEGTRRLAQQARQAGVRRLVYVSSIGVLGASTPLDQPFDDLARPKPLEPYAVSKLEAEQVLAEVAQGSELEVVVVRPPMVVGPGAPGNLGRLMKLVGRQWPLPVPWPANQRSLVQIENLVDFLLACVEHPAAAGETFVVADDERVSTAEMIRCLAEGMGLRARLVPVPSAVLAAGGVLAGKRRLYEKVFGSLTVDATRARTLLGWQPRVSTQNGLRKAGSAFRRLG